MAPKPRHGSPSLTPQARSIQISKALSWLLRHGAAKERIPIDAAGYVNLHDVLQWHKLRALNVTFSEIVDVVQSNEKQRFGLKWDDGELSTVDGETQTQHQAALACIESTQDADADPRQYSIRAVQGHSLKTVDAESLLTPITMANAPETCVHGTFFVSWPVILKSGGLKAMTRNHVHFATGPRIEDVLPEQQSAGAEETKLSLKSAMERSAVVSGMRGDAQVLIYVDIWRAVGNGMEWWRSDNGVLLTEGVACESKPASELEETAMMMEENSINGSNDKAVDQRHRHNHRKSQPPSSKQQKSVPMEYWDVVVGIGVGILWQKGQGVVQEVPADLMKGGKGKFGHASKPSGKGTGKGSAKPKMKVERDDLEGLSE